MCYVVCIFFFNDTATPAIYTLSLHDALPSFTREREREREREERERREREERERGEKRDEREEREGERGRAHV